VCECSKNITKLNQQYFKIFGYSLPSEEKNKRKKERRRKARRKEKQKK
jgi:hypothetical protein